MKMLKVSALAAALVLAVAPMANAQAGGGRGARGGGRMMQMLLQGIDLSAAQKAQIDSIQTAYRAKMPRMTPGQRPDSSARAAMRQTMLDETADIRKVLTPDQQKVLDRNAEEMRSRRGGRPSNRPSPHHQRRLDAPRR